MPGNLRVIVTSGQMGIGSSASTHVVDANTNASGNMLTPRGIQNTTVYFTQEGAMLYDKYCYDINNQGGSVKLERESGFLHRMIFGNPPEKEAAGNP